jgi:hypothetical protein
MQFSPEYERSGSRRPERKKKYQGIKSVNEYETNVLSLLVTGELFVCILYAFPMQRVCMYVCKVGFTYRTISSTLKPFSQSNRACLIYKTSVPWTSRQ